MVNSRTGEIELGPECITILKETDRPTEQISFLSNSVLDENEPCEQDVCWQVCCVILALACGKSPFRRDTKKETMRAIEEQDPDFSSLDALAE